MRPSTALLALSFLFAGPRSVAQDPAATSLRMTDLGRHPFKLGALNLSLYNYQKEASAGRYRVTLGLHNPSAAGASLDIRDLALVGHDGAQVVLCGWAEQRSPALKVLHEMPTKALSLAPGAHADLTFYLDGEVQFPARLYCGDRLLAEVSN